MKKHTYLITFLCLTVALAAVLYASYFLFTKMRSSLDTQERLTLEEHIENEQIKNLPILAEVHKGIIENESYFSFLYSEDRVVEIIKDIERIAKEEGVTLTITQKEVIKKKVVKKEEDDEKEGEEEKVDKKPKELIDTLPYEKNIRLDLQAEGQYSSIRNFIHKLETAPYALDVLSINATVAPKDDEDRTPASRDISESSPFLLSGESNTEQVPQQESQPDQIIATLETALYLQ